MCTCAKGGFVEEWPFIDDRELVPFRGMQSCSTCSSFGYVILGQCQTLGSCRTKQRLLPPQTQLIRRCKDWSYVSAAHEAP